MQRSSICFHSLLYLYILDNHYLYLILFPQHRKLVVINGWFYHLHIQVINAEIEIPKPEHHTVQKGVISWIQYIVHKYISTFAAMLFVTAFPWETMKSGVFCPSYIRVERFHQIFFAAYTIDTLNYMCVTVCVRMCLRMQTYSWSRTPVAAWPSNCCCCRMLSKSSMRCSEFSMWAGRWQLRKQMVWPNTDMRALTPPLFPWTRTSGS